MQSFSGPDVKILVDLQPLAGIQGVGVQVDPRESRIHGELLFNLADGLPLDPQQTYASFEIRAIAEDGASVGPDEIPAEFHLVGANLEVELFKMGAGVDDIFVMGRLVFACDLCHIGTDVRNPT